MNDGGPAFPTSIRVPENYMDASGYGGTREVTLQVGGMSLRDHFAACALQSFRLPSDYRDGECNAAAANRAYALADAMLSERERDRYAEAILEEERLQDEQDNSQFGVGA